MFSTLRARLIAVCVAIVVVALIVMAALTYWIVRDNTLKEIDDRMHSITASHADEVATWIQGKFELGALVPTVDHRSGEPLKRLGEIMELGGFEDVYMAFPDKSMLTFADNPEGYDPTSFDWYQDTISAAGTYLSEPYFEELTGSIIVSVLTPMREGGEFIGMAGADVALGPLNETLAAIQPYPGTVAVVVDRHGQIIAHKDKNLLLKPATQLEAQLSSAKLEQMAADAHARAQRGTIDGVPVLMYATRVKNTDFSFLVAAPIDVAMQNVASLTRVSIAIVAIAAVLTVALMVAFIRGQLTRLMDLRDALADIAHGQGDLSRRLNERGKDELAEIGHSFNTFTDKIVTLMRDIRGAASAVQLAATEIASGNQDLSARTEVQAGSLQKTSSAMEQLTATVTQNADNAAQANQVGQDAAQVATQANTAVQQVVSTMGAISQSSNKIKDIIGVIDNIAFQTNILALNAAVEAARAGEQGRGFAVVAAEVRSLAQRSATAAKEIKDLIDASVAQAQDGSRLVDEAGVVMGQVVEHIAQASAIVGEITSASREQSAGITEVGGAITEMDQATQQNAALVEQSAAAATALQQQAAHLAELVTMFKLDQNQRSNTLKLK